MRSRSHLAPVSCPRAPSVGLVPIRKPRGPALPTWFCNSARCPAIAAVCLARTRWRSRTRALGQTSDGGVAFQLGDGYYRLSHGTLVLPQPHAPCPPGGRDGSPHGRAAPVRVRVARCVVAGTVRSVRGGLGGSKGRTPPLSGGASDLVTILMSDGAVGTAPRRRGGRGDGRAALSGDALGVVAQGRRAGGRR